MAQKRNKALGRGVGSGHGGNTPNLPVVRPVDPLPPALELLRQAGQIEKNLKMFKMGKVQILVGQSDSWGWHLSISHPERYPTWDEIAKARYELIPDEAIMVMVLPPRGDYINIHNFCFQLHEVFDHEGRLTLLPSGNEVK